MRATFVTTAARPHPLVSIVMATYNRSNLLPYVIETVRRQRWPHWELLVVGDGCTDDTADVIASIADSRVRFWNLEQPVGEQSGPNNAGCAAARGDYVAFLNHDDFWTPGHLERAVQTLEGDPTIDLVYGINIALYPGGRFVVWGATPPGATLPVPGVPASGWVLRRELVDRVGPWRPARELFLVPSQDWLQRASRAGRLRALPYLSVLSFPSGSRPRSYADRTETEHAAWFERMATDPLWAEHLLTEVLCDRDLSSWKSGNSCDIVPFVARAIKNAGKRLAASVGVSPLAATMWIRYGRRGGFVARARRVRGIANE